eukprot:TRINITY_DN1441_c0_g1_i2.p1 TRINITY_DN1441_c0_g1~~TRINITY_DN1441_c0_g1_i2.p1  ORF type:complete len:460 (-),score=118.78 TRINITY_DN1441_c0_g1_i2:171-1550(-)
MQARGWVTSQTSRIQLTAIELADKAGKTIPLRDACISVPGNSSEEDHPPTNLLKGDDRMWIVNLKDHDCNYSQASADLDYERAALVLQLPKPVEATAFRFQVGKDLPQRDPIAFTISGSNDAKQWIPLHVERNCGDSMHRLSWSEWFELTPRRWPIEPLSPGWHRLRVRAVDKALVIYLDEQRIGNTVDTTTRSGYVGLCASRCRVMVNNYTLENLSTYADFVKERDTMVFSEARALEKERLHEVAHAMQTLKAARLIQDVQRMKNSYVKQRMLRYEMAKESGTEQALRQRKLLSWMALLSVLNKMNDKLHEPALREDRERKFLKALPPPPPPPPLAPPPTDAEEELHFQYQAMREVYAPQWDAVGRDTLGAEKWEEMRSKPHGPAQKQKKLICLDYLRKAREATTEGEHQDYLLRAWKLEHAWKSLHDNEHGRSEKAEHLQRDEVRRWATEVMLEHGI